MDCETKLEIPAFGMLKTWRDQENGKTLQLLGEYGGGEGDSIMYIGYIVCLLSNTIEHTLFHEIVTSNVKVCFHAIQNIRYLYYR